MKRYFLYIFPLLWAFITFVEVYDIYWSIKLQEVLYVFEKNPIGKWLISMDDGDVALFMSFKAAAIITALSSTAFLYMVGKYRIAFVALILLFLSRFFLLLYLETGHLWWS